MSASDSKLIHSVLQRIGEKLPVYSGRNFDDFLKDPLLHELAVLIIEISPFKINLVGKGLVNLFENVAKSNVKDATVDESALPQMVLQTQLYLIKLLNLCLNSHWKFHTQNKASSKEDFQNLTFPATASTNTVVTDRSSTLSVPKSVANSISKELPPLTLPHNMKRMNNSVMSLNESSRKTGSGLVNQLGSNDIGSASSGVLSVPQGPSKLSSVVSLDNERNFLQNTLKRFSSNVKSSVKFEFGLKSRYEVISSQLEDSNTAGIDDKLAIALYFMAVKILQSYNAADISSSSAAFTQENNPVYNFGSILFSDLPRNFVDALDLNESAEDSLSQHMKYSPLERLKAAGKLMFIISATNWEIVFGRLRARLLNLANSTSEDYTEMNELKALEWCHLNEKKLGSVLRECSSICRNLKKNVLLTLAPILRRSIWNWISLFPHQYSVQHLSNRKADDYSESIFEVFYSMGESSKKKYLTFPICMSLIIISPDMVNSLSSNSGSYDITNSSHRKTVPHLFFFENLKHQIFSGTGKSVDLAAYCLIDFCKGAATISDFLSGTNSNNTCAILKIATVIEPLLKARLFDPQHPFSGYITNLNNDMFNYNLVEEMNSTTIEERLIIDFLVSSSKRSSEFFYKSTLEIFMQNDTSDDLKLVLLKTIFVLLADSFTQVDVSIILNHVSAYIRKWFLEYCDPKISSSSVSNLRQVSTGLVKVKKTGEDDQVEIVENILRVFTVNPKLALSTDSNPNKFDDSKNIIQGLSLFCMNSNPYISTLARETLVDLHSAENIETWGYSHVIMSSFWSISSVVTITIVKKAIEDVGGVISSGIRNSFNPSTSGNVHSSLVYENVYSNAKTFLKVLLDILVSRNEFLEKRIYEASVGSDIEERDLCLSKIETCIIFCLCAGDFEVNNLGLDLLKEFCREIAIVENLIDLQLSSEVTSASNGEKYHQKNSSGLSKNYAVYIKFLGSLESSAVSTSGRTAAILQKKLRKLFRSLEYTSEGLLSAWVEIYLKWRNAYKNPNPASASATASLSDSQTIINTEGKKKMPFLISHKIQSHLMKSIASTNIQTSESYPGEDAKLEWQNCTGILCSLGGVIFKRIDKFENITLKQFQDDDKSIANASVSNLNDESMAFFLNNFITNILDMMVCDQLFIREGVKDFVGLEMSNMLYPLFFKHLQHINLRLGIEGSGDDSSLISSMMNGSNVSFDSVNDSASPQISGTNNNVAASVLNYSAAKLILHIEQSVSILKITLDKINGEDEFYQGVDYAGFVNSYIKILSKYSKSADVNSFSRIKIKLCNLVEVLIQKRDLVNLRDEIRFRNKLVEIFVEWTSIFELSRLEDKNIPVKLQKDLDIACLKAVVCLLHQLPLQPVGQPDTIDDVSELKSTLFLKYFDFFINILRRLRSEDIEKKVESSSLKDYAINALSNLLSSNIDTGLKYSLSVGYHEDFKTRAAFMQVLSNLLNQGTEFENLAETFATERLYKLIDYLVEPDMAITLALAEWCPASDLDDLASVLLNIFYYKGKSKLLLRTLIEREVLRTESPANLFRRNSIATKMITIDAKHYGEAYLRATIEPVFNELIQTPNLLVHPATSLSDNRIRKEFNQKKEVKSFEVDPNRLLPGENLTTNLKNLKWLCSKFLDAVLSSLPNIPQELRTICHYLIECVKKHFPEANMNVVIGGFIFLRFFNPIIVSPVIEIVNDSAASDITVELNINAYGNLSTNDLISKELKRGLVLASKVIQNLANNVLFGSKESYMKEMNGFIQLYYDRVNSFLKSLSDSRLSYNASGGSAKVSDYDQVDSISKESATLDEIFIHKLHKYLHDSIDFLNQELTSRNGKLYKSIQQQLYPASFPAAVTSHSRLTQTITKLQKRMSEAKINVIGPAASTKSINYKRHLDSLSHLLAQLGNPISTQSNAENNRIRHSVDTNYSPKLLYTEFMNRLSQQQSMVDFFKQQKFIYEAGISKGNDRVIYLILRRIKPNESDLDSFLFYILKVLTNYNSSSGMEVFKFTLVVDLSLFKEENEFQNQQYLFQFLQLLPIEVLSYCTHVLLYNISNSFKKYIKQYLRFITKSLYQLHTKVNLNSTASLKILNSFFSKVICINTLSEFNEYITPMELQLPRTTFELEQDLQLFAPVSLRINNNPPAQVCLKINQNTFQMSSLKKMEVFYSNYSLNSLNNGAIVNDIFLIEELEEILWSNENEEIIIRLNQGRLTFYLNFPRKREIVSCIQKAKDKSSNSKIPLKQVKHRVLKPSDVPGTLLNIALINLGAEDSDLRLAAYNLLCSLSNVFNFEFGNLILNCKGLLVPSNITSLIISISEKLAHSQPQFSVEFLRECFIGFDKSDTKSKHLCLEYMVPWLNNLILYYNSSGSSGVNSEKNSKKISLVNGKKHINEIINLLIQTTVKEKEMFPSIQSKVWSTLGSVEELIPIILEQFINFSSSCGFGSVDAEVIADACVTLASSNVYLVSGIIIRRLRVAVGDIQGVVSPRKGATIAELGRGTKFGRNVTKSQTLDSNVSDMNLIGVLLRISLMLSFHNRLNVQQYFPELLHLIVMLVGSGPILFKASVYGITINLIHSLCTTVGLNEQQLKRILKIIQDLNEPRYRLLFGVSNNSCNAFLITSETVTEDGSKKPEEVSLTSLESVTNLLLDVLNNFNGTELFYSWRARWVSLATSTAFQFNPLLQARGFIELGCLVKGEADEDLLFQILFTLRKALLFFDEQDCRLIISIIICLTDVIDYAYLEYTYLTHIFWLAISLLQMGQVNIFLSSLNLLQAVVRNLNQKGFFIQENPVSLIIRSREPLKEVLDSLEQESGISFTKDVGFAIAAVLMKGMKNSSTKHATMITLNLIISIWSKFLFNGNLAQNDKDMTLVNQNIANIVHPYLLGLISPLVPYIELSDMKELFWTIGVNLDEAEDEIVIGINENLKHIHLAECLKLDSSNIGSHLLVALWMIALENSETEQEVVFFYNFFADATFLIPDIIGSYAEKIIPKTAQIITNTPSIQLLNAANRLIQGMVFNITNEVSSPVASLDSLFKLDNIEESYKGADSKSIKRSPTEHGFSAHLANLSKTLTLKTRKRPSQQSSTSSGGENTSKTRSQMSLSNSSQEPAVMSRTSESKSAQDPAQLNSSKYVAEIGFSGITTNESCSFNHVLRAKKYSIANLTSQLIESMLQF